MSEPGIGHNDAHARLRSVVERVERLQEERKGLSADISDIFREAKSAGYDVKALRELLRLYVPSQTSVAARHRWVSRVRPRLMGENQSVGVQASPADRALCEWVRGLPVHHPVSVKIREGLRA